MVKKLILVSFLLLISVSFVFADEVDVVSVKVSSFEKKFQPEKAIDGKSSTRWSSEHADPQWIMLDLGKKITINKVFFHWESAYAKSYQLQVSNDGKKWYIVYYTDNCQGGKEKIDFKPVKVRYIRMFGIERKTGWGYSLFEFKVYSTSKSSVPLKKLDSFSASTILKLAQESPKTYYSLAAGLSSGNYYPLWMNKKQGYFIVVGSEKGFNESAVCEDGMIDAGKKKFSVIPYLYINKKLISIIDLKAKLSLEDDYLPIPIIEGRYKGLSFKQRVFAWGKNENDYTYIQYTLKNKSKKIIKGKLYLTIRPFEVNPPWQHGGLIDLFAIEYINKNTIKINNEDTLLSLNKSDGFGALSYQQGDIMNFISKGTLPSDRDAYDPLGGASGAFEFQYKLSPGQKKEYNFVIPIGKKCNDSTVVKDDAVRKFKKAKSFWQKKLNKVKIKISDKYIYDVLRSNLAYILINKDGSALQGSSRFYERSYIRDTAILGVALLRLGLKDEVKECIDWVIKRQLLPNGEVLPMVLPDGSALDWYKTKNEYDGQGCFLYIIAEYYRFTKDKRFLKDCFPAVMKAVKFIQYLRKQRLSDELKNGPIEKKMFYGLLPISVSHEGYIEPGVHSYWDDYWALKGLSDAKEMALVLGKTKEYKRIKKEEHDLRKCLLDSIKLIQKFKKIKYIPGCPDFGDLDPTSTAISVWPTEVAPYLSQKDLIYTLDKYYNDTFLPTRMDGKKKIDCIPYEMRTANAYLLLGEKEKALKIFKYFLKHLKPKEWKNWIELIHYKYREPKFIGDMPHSWAGAIFINLIRNMLVFEKNNTLVLGLGIDEEWLNNNQELSIQNCPTYFSEINYSMKKDNNTLGIKVWGKAKPENGFVFKSPFLKKKIKKVKINGKKWTKFSKNEILFNELPAEILVIY